MHIEANEETKALIWKVPSLPWFSSVEFGWCATIAENFSRRQNFWQSRFLRPTLRSKPKPRDAFVHKTTRPETISGFALLLVSDQQAYSVVAITFKFSVVALLSLVPGRASSTNQLWPGWAACVKDVALSVWILFKDGAREFWFGVDACIARALIPTTAAVTSAAATKRLVILAWSLFITPPLQNL